MNNSQNNSKEEKEKEINTGSDKSPSNLFSIGFAIRFPLNPRAIIVLT
ncbi:MAG TPA: hypothetical protein VE445_03400 [Nitrososphaeraceae archaeon]|nr:hypothetical protein [Nitrososphaeraceae archaeon]